MLAYINYLNGFLVNNKIRLKIRLEIRLGYKARFKAIKLRIVKSNIVKHISLVIVVFISSYILVLLLEVKGLFNLLRV